MFVGVSAAHQRVRAHGHQAVEHPVHQEHRIVRAGGFWLGAANSEPRLRGGGNPYRGHEAVHAVVQLALARTHREAVPRAAEEEQRWKRRRQLTVTVTTTAQHAVTESGHVAHLQPVQVRRV